MDKSNLKPDTQIKNLDENTTACITIQCYIYGETDTVHYDYFDYLDDNGNKKPYEPDSDMDYVSFKKLIREEWLSRVNN